MTKKNNWTKLRGKVYKLHRKWIERRVCPRVPYMTTRNKYRYISADVGHMYKFINKSHYDFRC